MRSATIFGTSSLLTLALGGSGDTVEFTPPRPGTPPEGFVGFWQNADGSVRLCLGGDGSYEGRIAGRRRSARGVYHLAGEGVVLRDESGLRTPVTVAADYLEMAGHQLYKVRG